MPKTQKTFFEGLVIDGPLPPADRNLLTSSEADTYYRRLDQIMSQHLPDTYKAAALRILSEDLFGRLMKEMPPYHFEDTDEAQAGSLKKAAAINQFFRIYYVLHCCCPNDSLYEACSRTNDMFNRLMHPGKRWGVQLNVPMALRTLTRVVFVFSQQPIPPRIRRRYEPTSLMSGLDRPLRVILMPQLTADNFSQMQSAAAMLLTMQEQIAAIRREPMRLRGLTFTIAAYDPAIYHPDYVGQTQPLPLCRPQMTLSQMVEKAITDAQPPQASAHHTPILVWAAFTLPDTDDTRTAIALVNRLRSQQRLLLTAVALTDEAEQRFRELLHAPAVNRVEPSKTDNFMANFLEEISKKYGTR